MIRKILTLMSSAAVASCMFVSVLAAEVVLIRDSQALARIYIHPEETVPVQRMQHYRMLKFPSELLTAVEDLNYHLEKMSGTKLEIVQETDAGKIQAPAIVVGKLAQELGIKAPETEWREGYRIVAGDGRVVIAGERDVSSAYGVYALLQILGCDWVMPGPTGEVIPARNTVAVASLDLASAPDFGLRWLWVGGGPKHYLPEFRKEFDQWLRRQRFGTGEEFRERLNEAHMWNKVVAKYKAEFAAQPELLALVPQPDGSYVRQGPQIETANPDAVALTARYIRELFAEKDWPRDKSITLAVGPADGEGYSESPEARALTPGPDRIHPIAGARDITDSVVKLANDVLAIVGAEFPNLTLGYYIYSYHDDFPAFTEPHPRIRPIFAPITYSRLHSTLDPHSKTRAYYRHIVEKWSVWAKQNQVPLMVYEYNWNLADNQLPYTRIRSMAEDLKFYKEHGFFGVTVQGTNSWTVVAPTNYILAKLAWDTSLDWRQVLQEFCGRAYGSAAPELERYYLRLISIQSESGFEAGSFFSTPLIFDEAYLKAARADIDSALARQDLSGNQRIQIQAVDFGFRKLELYMHWHEASNAFDFTRAMAFGNQLREVHDAALKVSNHYFDRASGIYINRLLLKSTEESLRYSSPPYRIIYQIPEALPTMFDPAGSGDKFNLYGNKINDSRWLKTHTYSSTWDAQGLGLLRTGSVWYRTRFKVPAELRGQHIGLLLGAFEDEARIWLNEAYLGSSGIRYPQPAALDLTDAVLYGEENLLTIEIRRNSKANELLLGGLLRPSFVFTGPKVETPEPPRQRVRVLPGGEIEVIPEPEK